MRIFLSLLIAATTAFASSVAERRARVAAAAPYVFKISAPTSDGGAMVGTAFQLKLRNGTRYLITARHVCDVGILGLLFIGYRPVRIFHKSEKYDLCAIEPMPTTGGLYLAPQAPEPYGDAYTLGHPEGLALQYYDGYWTGRMEVGPNLWADAWSFPAVGGQSGSPILNSRGQVIGLLAWIFKDNNQAMGVQWAQLRDFISTFSK